VVHQRPADWVAITFAGLLRQLRDEARLTQEELAEKTGLSPRSISDLERGVSRTARKCTALLLADALGISGSMQTAFVAAARGRAPVTDVLAARDSTAAQGRHAAPARAGTLVWYAAEDDGLTVRNTRLIGLFDGRPAAVVCEGSAVTGLWLIRHDGIRWQRYYIPLRGSSVWFIQDQLPPTTD
jgi:transcriptional regulator with XRE-family HTH domain